MKKHHHRYPQTLISFQHLEGGMYGSFAIIARDRDTIEVQLGNDFVRMNTDGASQVAQALEMFAGAPPELVVEVDQETEEDVITESETVIEERELPRARRVAPRRRRAT